MLSLAALTVDLVQDIIDKGMADFMPGLRRAINLAEHSNPDAYVTTFKRLESVTSTMSQMGNLLRTLLGEGDGGEEGTSDLELIQKAMETYVKYLSTDYHSLYDTIKDIYDTSATLIKGVADHLIGIRKSISDESIFLLHYAIFNEVSVRVAMEQNAVNLTSQMVQYKNAVETYRDVLMMLSRGTPGDLDSTSVPLKVFKSEDMKNFCENTVDILLKKIDDMILRLNDQGNDTPYGYADIMNITDIPDECTGDFFSTISEIISDLQEHNPERYEEIFQQLQRSRNRVSLRASEKGIHQVRADIQYYVDLYTQMNATKLELADKLVHNKLQDAKDEADRFVVDVFISLIDPTRKAIGDIANDIRGDYRVLMQAASKLIPYFTPVRFRDQIQHMSVWYRHLVKIAGKSIQVTYSKNPDTIFESLPEEEIYPNDSNVIIGEHLDAYLEDLYRVLDVHDSNINDYKYHLNNIIDEAIDSLKASLGAADITMGFVR